MSEEEKKTKRPVGRPTDYRPEYCQKLISYFDIDTFFERKKQIPSKEGPIEVFVDEASEIPMFQDFCRSIGVHRETLLNWCEKHPEFLDAYKKAKELQELIIAKNAIKGRYDKTFSIFMLKCNHGWNDGSNQFTGTIKIDIDEDESQL